MELDSTTGIVTVPVNSQLASLIFAD
jgi:hypothetical protein